MNDIPEKILEKFSNKALDKTSAVENLITIIENSDRVGVRLECIKILEEIGLRNDRIFNLMENLLISDAHEKIRNTAALYIKNNFLEKSLKPMNWALLNERSPLCLTTIYETLILFLRNFKNLNETHSKSILIEEIKKAGEKDFKIGFETIFESEERKHFTTSELTDILINYFTITFFKKIFWRLKYKIENCKIVILDFIFKRLTLPPEGIKHLTSLKELILRYNQIVNLPKWIGFLSSLEILNLNVNNLRKIPESIGSLSNLKKLLLWKNDIESLPNSIGNLNSLEELNLRLNRICILPDAIGKLNSLKILNLHDNKLKNIPESIGSLLLLEKLNLSWNEITSLPNSFGSLASLQDLDLSRNEITYIPESFGLLKNLKILDLKDNKLNDIPDSLFKLSNLKILGLSNNDLSYIPDSFGSLISLNELYLGGNRITEIPKSLEELEESGLKIYY